jgi:hypothetical protein
MSLNNLVLTKMKIVELAAVIGRDARDVSPSEAMDYVDGKTNRLALDNCMIFSIELIIIDTNRIRFGN